MSGWWTAILPAWTSGPPSLEDAFLQGLPYLVKNGFHAWGPYTHACVESDFLGELAEHSNFFGIHKPSWWTKATLVHTDTDAQGKVYTTEFVQCATVAEGLEVYRDVVERAHPLAYAARHDPQDFFEALQLAPAWAENPHYLGDLQRAYRRTKLNLALAAQLDQLMV